MATDLGVEKCSGPKLVRERRVVFSDNPSCDSLFAAPPLWRRRYADCSLLSVKKRLEDVQLRIAAARLYG